MHGDDKKKKSKAVLEEEKRKEGLETSLDASNRGFALLAKMGYKAGESLGKDKTSGRTEPIPISLKNDRGGLGREAARKQIKATRIKLLSEKVAKTLTSTTDFRALQSQKLKAKRVEGDLFRAQKSCRQLDMAKNCTEPIESWFWPKVIQAELEDVNEAVEASEAQITEIVQEETEEDDLEAEVEIPSEEMLRIVTEYLRAEYLFCIWCGITFESNEDLSQTCPGNSREDHDD